MNRSRLEKCAKLGAIIEQVRNILSDNPKEVLMLAAGQNGLPITFTDVIEDASLRTFICSVQVGNILDNCMGYGQTKDEAKMNAAEKAIAELVSSMKDLSPSSSRPPKHENTAFEDRHSTKRGKFSPSSSFESGSEREENILQMRSRPPPQFSSLRSSASPGAFSSNTSLSDSPGFNSIGALQELAQKNNWPIPIYEEIDEYGEDHKKTFVITCKFKNKVSEGKAKSKKAAKKEAAEAMLTMIGSNRSPLKNPSSNSESSQARSSTSRPVVSQGTLGYPSTSHVTKQPAKYPGYYLDKLTKKLASKGKLTLETHKVPEKGLSGNCLCFLKLNTNPVTVCAGSGPTELCAKDDAARNALKILK